MFGNPRDVLRFKPRSELKKVENALSKDNRGCNMCALIRRIRQYNSNDVEYDLSEMEDCQDISRKYYTDGDNLDVCVRCMDLHYPQDNELKEAVFFWGMVYDQGHYYPNFPEMRHLLYQYANLSSDPKSGEDDGSENDEGSEEDENSKKEDLKSIDIYTLKYRGIRLLDMLTSYNIMLEYVSIFGIKINEMLKIFIDSIDQREDNLENLGLGYIHPSPPLVIYKFFEKSIRYFFYWSCRFRPDEKDLKPPDFKEYFSDTDSEYMREQNQHWYDEAVERWENCVEFNKNINVYPNQYKICRNDSDFYEKYDIWRVSYLYDICFLEDIDEDNNYLPMKFESEINQETKEILENFLDLYKDLDYMSVEDSELYELDRRYHKVEDEVFLKALYKFKESIGEKQEILDFLQSQYNLHQNLIEHLRLFVRGPPPIPNPAPDDSDE